MSVPFLTPLAAALLHVPPPERAVVLNSGDGEAALLLAREFPAARVRGVDARSELVRQASARVGLDPEGRVVFKVGRPGALPYPDGFFDLAVQIDGRPAAGEVSRILQPGGHFVLARSSEPGFGSSVRRALLERWLARRGLAIERAESSGDGNFLVARLRAGERSRAPD
ncbi:MAG TPA: class I SAM-dependent methyltransferase [Solirubrobacterales bacterium]|nr:class I SAM-dependent methyltransferase [Solirubrobacterales bacterium]